MILNDELIAKIIKLASRTTSENKVNNFFTNIFPKFSENDKAKIISIFIQRQGKRIFYHYVGKHEEIENIIKKRCISEINSFYGISNEDDKKICFDLINLYLNISGNEIETDNLDKIMYIFNKMLIENSINSSDTITEILINYIKFIAYNYTVDNENIKKIEESQSFDIFERIIIKYIEQLNISNKSLNDDLLMLLMEVRKMTGFDIIDKVLTKKGYTTDLNDFNNYININIPIDSDKFDKFCESIILYKLSNAILPKEICLYIYKFYSDNEKLIRIANMDIVQNYLRKNGVNDAICFQDSLLYHPGIAGTKYMALRHNDLSRDLFHEATHIIQKSNAHNNKNFTGYRYDILKDLLIQKNISWNDYNGINHDKFLFEIEADIQGSKQCGMIMTSIGHNTSDIATELLFIDETEQRRIDESKTIILHGTEVNKKELFDSIIMKKPEYIKQYPVFSIEYNDDGSKKNSVEIFNTLENYRVNKIYSEEELSAIEICIFGKSIENRKSMR